MYSEIQNYQLPGVFSGVARNMIIDCFEMYLITYSNSGGRYADRYKWLD